MGDILYDCANAFDNVLKYSYKLDVSRNQQPLVITMNCLENEITHVIGLDHLKDMTAFRTNNSNKKASVFHQILNSDLTLSDIQKSSFFNVPFSSTYNTAKNAPYNLSERITALRDIEKILDSAYTGEFYKWNKNNAKIITQNGKQRQTSIDADYMLKVPSKANPDESIYLFFYKEKSAVRNKGEPIKLHLFSAFADCVDLTQGQESPFKILQETKINVIQDTSNSLYKSPNYDPNISIQIKIKSDISEFAIQLYEKRITFVRNETEGNLEKYLEVRNKFFALVDENKMYEYAKGLLEKQRDKILQKAQKAGENDAVSYIDEEIQYVQKKQDIDDTATRQLKFQIRIGKDTPNFSIQDGVLSLNNTSSKTISFSLPYPPKKPFKAIYTKIKSLINNVSNVFKSKHKGDKTLLSSNSDFVQKQQEQKSAQNEAAITHNNPEKQIFPNKTISFEHENELVQDSSQSQIAAEPPKAIVPDKDETVIHTDTLIDEKHTLKESYQSQKDSPVKVKNKKDAPEITLSYEGDAESLDEIKDVALALGATVTMDEEKGVIFIDTCENHYEEIEDAAYELGLLDEETKDIEYD